ncbi:MAG: Ig-like domain-containing protein [Isosphaeraceae bacterium]|nr:Ig-like domain-containing protein [Isosphaeraceae bacterium]
MVREHRLLTVKEGVNRIQFSWANTLIDPTSIEFPFSFSTTSSSVIANGSYSYTLASPATGTAVVSEDGKPLSPYSASFSINDTTAPRITDTTFAPRQVNIQFSEPMRPSSINAQTVILVYQSPSGPVFLNTNPAYKVTYNSATETATIDLSSFSQVQLPSGTYFLTVLGAGKPGEPSVTDLVGNDLNGQFNGYFPSGVPDQAVTVPPTPTPHSDFVQALNFSLSAPIVTSFQLTPQSDSGIQGDENTNSGQPTFIGQVTNGFLGPIAGLTVLIEFNALHGGNLDLQVGGGGRGYTGSYDVVATTNANGSFTVTGPFLPEGFITARVLVIGQPDQPPLPGLSSFLDSSFRIDQTPPTVVGATLVPTAGTATLLPLQGPNNFASLTAVSLDVQDPNNPPAGSFSTPPSVLYPALDPSTVANVSNFTLYNVTLGVDESSYIASATFVPTGTDFVTTPPSRASSSDPNAGRIDLTFAPGLPEGKYILIAHTAETVTETNNGVTTSITYSGLRDAAGNPLDDTGKNVAGLPSGVPVSAKDFSIEFNIQPEPAYITGMNGVSAYTGGPSDSPNNVVGGPRSYYEIPVAGNTPRANAPPTAFVVDFSNALSTTDPTTGLPINFNNAVVLARSADSAAAQPDGDFGNLGQGGLGATGTGFSTVPVTVTLYDPPAAGSSGLGIAQGQAGFNPLTATRLVVRVTNPLPADDYRIYLPNTEPTAANPVGSALYDIYGNQVDGEFLGNPTAQGYYQNLLSTGAERGTAAQPDLSGDGVAGGAFETGFVVVPNGNVIYARPGYVENPLDPSTMPDGSLAKPYPVLAPQVLPADAPANPTNNPNGGMNSTSLFFEAFTQANGFVDRAGSGKFERSALAAAQYLSANGPVVVIALPGIQQRNPITGVVSTPTFVLQAPAGSSDVYNDGSASVPYDTMLVFNPGSTLKLENASLFAQNQGSSIQVDGGATPSEQVHFTSYKDDTVAGDTNGDGSNTTPQGGDWGGIVFRNYDYATTRSSANASVPVDGTPVGPGGAPAISGEDDALSFINYADISFGGGAVPATQGYQYDSITAFNSRPFIANAVITGGGNSSDATISGDLNSFREDDLTRGMLVRNTIVQDASINGIWIRPDSTGVAEATDAMQYPNNPVTLGGTVNYVFDSPLPYVLTSQLVIGQQLVLGSGGHLNSVMDRLFIAPGMMVKSEEGAGIEIVTAGASFIVGDRTYITGWDATATTDPTTGLPVSSYGPSSPNFQADSANDAQVLFTSALDNTATTFYYNPATQQDVTIVPAISVLNTPNSEDPTPTSVSNSQRWGSVTIASGAIALINDATFQYGGGQLNLPGGTTTRNVLTLNGSGGRTVFTPPDPTNPLSTGTFTLLPGLGSRSMITNNNFYYNADTPIMADPNAFLAADPTTPLSSGDPFIHGNVFVGNGLNGVGINVPASPPLNSFNLSNNSVWAGGDFTYILRGTVIPEADPAASQLNTTVGTLPAAGTPMPKPWITLTIQSTLPGTVLADGEIVGKPGQPVLVKLLGAGPGDGITGGTNGYNAGAGFLFGVDDGIDPPVGLLVDQGANDQLRILGIAGDETTGQQQVPAILTSVHDSTVGTTVRGVGMFTVIPGDTTAPKAGDGGLIYFGANSLTTYNALDIREGNKIDNADISYITRIELQGGGVINTDKPDYTLIGNELTISDSNLNAFSQVGVLTEQVRAAILVPNRTSIIGEPTLLYMYNDTIANMPVGVRIDGEPIQAPGQQPVEYVALNNTYYNNGIGVDLEGIYGSEPGAVQFAGMDNIFSNSTTAAIVANGNTQGSILEYNLFYSNGADDPNGVPNFGAVSGNPQFRNAAAGDFALEPNSAAIDAGRSEMSLLNMTVGSSFGGRPADYATLVPLTNQVLDATGGTWNGNTRNAGIPSFAATQAAVSVLTLPGFTERGYVDEWEAVLPTDANAILGPASNAATFAYEAITGQRDQLGYLRQDDPNVPNVGFGSNPFFDIGAFEYRILTPPQVTAFSNGDGVIANLASGTQKDIYAVGSVGGLNQSPQSIQIHFSHNLDPATINGSTVILEESGGDGIFGNGNSPLDKSINLAGKLSFNSATNVLTINIGAAGLVLPNDEYRIVLEGNGSNVIADPEGNALDGENTLNDDPNNPQLALPSGDGFPGGNFYTSFVINTQAPSLVSGTLKLAAASDTNVADQITANNLPSFTGTISVAQPKIDPLAGQTVIIDISTAGNGVFNLLNVGTGVTNAQGQFTVSVNSPLPNSPYNVGGDGLLNSPANSSLSPKNDDVGYSQVRVRIIDQSGNVSDTITDPLSAFLAKGALDYFVVDTQAPTITSISPAAGAVVSPSQTTGAVTLTVVTSKNITPSSLNTTNIQVVNAGPDGVLGTADDVPIPVNPSSIKIAPMGGAPGINKGPETITFSISGNLPNGLYQVTLKGTGSSPIIDIPGNALAGNGSTAGTNYTSTFIVQNTGTVGLIYVDGSNTTSATNTATLGSRENPYPTIQAGINAAVAGDIVAVLPGVYNQQITLKSLVRVLSADPSSTDTNLVAGDALQTIIRQPAPTSSTAAVNATVTATNLFSAPGLPTEIAGFTITSTLLGDAALGVINPTTAGIWIQNSNILVDRDYVIDNQNGILVGLGGPATQTPQIENDVVAGNVDGLFLDGTATSISIASPTNLVQVLNNDFAFNTVGLYAFVNADPPLLANVGNNIFYENHDQTTARNGAGVAASFPGAIVLRENMFQSNGASDTNGSGAGFNVGNGFNGNTLTTTPDSFLGNFLGNPAFVSPIDPRPGSDGPANFFLNADFDLTITSAAIDAGLTAPGGYAAPTTDFLLRGRVKIAGRGFPGTGPIDVGAFEYQGSGGTPVGGAFRVVTTNLAPGGATHANNAWVNAQALPNDIIVVFSQNVNKATVTANDLVLSGTGLSGSNPAHAVGLTWIDNDTVEFFLSGSYNSSGTVNVSVAPNSITSANNAAVQGYADSIQLYTPAPAPPPTPTPTPTPAPTPTPKPRRHRK